MHRGHTPSIERRVVAMSVALVLCLLTVGCGSSKSESLIATTTTNPASGCPFSGTTAPTSGPTKTDVAASLTKVTPRKSKCIDNVQFDFSPGVPAWSVGYQTGPFADSATGKSVTVPGSHLLVVQFRGVDASYAGPGTINPNGLNYVQQVTLVTEANGVVDWIISLDQELEYTTSTSGTPAYFVLGLG